MPFVCEVCGKEFARKFNLDRHQERKHRDESVVASEEVVVDPETGSCRKRDVFDDDSDISYEHDTDALDSPTDEEDKQDDGEDEYSAMSQDETNVSDEDESAVEEESTTETDSDQSGPESDASSHVSSDPASSDDSEEYGYDSGDEEEEWTLFRDWTIRLTQEPGDVPQRVIKETKRSGKRIYLVEFAALPRYGYNIEYSKNWVPEQTLMKKYGYLVLK
ncbi:Crystallin, lambda 1 [Branchiostoma belcheri]|nr:Crystallin, lambda 1 [Branchiostoma belcheri]KAI8495590.1 Crystallin, lambda 1 [Branchiostoma belcheri]KAI8508626.1 Crystallin, lambda 1 [Branchiostoma belcheri]KAI8508627.1 Crystallin, lambda 1 [Branchiostoma belcheri]